MMQHFSCTIKALLLLLGIGSSVVSVPGFASTESSPKAENFFEYSLQELLEVDVTVASKEAESILDTPAIVSRYEADDLAAMGLTDLKEILSFIPGLVVQEGLNGNTPVMIRGISEGYNQKVLFLIDDVPYFMPSHSEIPLLGVPIEAISHVEIIRGPGAVYYGTNATAGVIKVVTRKTGNGRMVITGGNNSWVNSGARFHAPLGNETSLSLSVGTQRDGGYDGYYDGTKPIPASFPADTPTTGTIHEAEEFDSAILRLDLKNSHFVAQAFRSTTNGVDGAGTVINHNVLDYKGWMLHGHHHLHLGEGHVSLFTDYNNFYLNFAVEKLLSGVTDGGFRFTDGGRKNFRWRSGTDVDYPLAENLNLFAGAEYEIRSSGDYEIFNADTREVVGTIMPGHQLYEASVYGQLDYRPATRWRLLGGARWTNNEISGGDATPRLSCVYNLDETSSLKLLYSVGFNSPSFTQQSADFPGTVKGNPDLGPEKVHTMDLAYSLVQRSNLLVFNVFYLEAKDFILKDRSTGEINFFNAGNFERWGCEADFQRAVGRHRVFANLAYHYEGGEELDDDFAIEFVPVLTTAVGLNASLGKGHHLGGSLRTIAHRSRAPSLALLNLSYQYSWRQWQLFGTVRNVLDEEILHPNVGDFNDRLIVGGQGRNLRVGVRLQQGR